MGRHCLRHWWLVGKRVSSSRLYHRSDEDGTTQYNLRNDEIVGNDWVAYHAGEENRMIAEVVTQPVTLLKEIRTRITGISWRMNMTAFNVKNVMAQVATTQVIRFLSNL